MWGLTHASRSVIGPTHPIKTWYSSFSDKESLRGVPLSMFLYYINLAPLAEDLWGLNPALLASLYADNEKFDGAV